MLTKEQLIIELTVDPTKGFIERLAVILPDQHYDLNELIGLTFHTNKQIGFHAAWLLDTMMLTHPERYIEHLEYFAKRMADVTNESCKRHYARIMMHLTMPDAPATIRQKLAAIDMEDVVEKCFDWLIDPKVKVAVKVFAADTLFNLHRRYDWIKEELANQMQFIMRTGGPAIQSRGKKLLAAMESKN
ncbi:MULTISPECIES: hypothetical protein [unclassified Mucilaginibacter]|uniref:hypothetical protein n=1 Tax=unclassified Mucilaginibacter TaxID=2617802 RepID=UPI002AC9620F|nr:MULTISPECIES: hypothetical protein [unclassified Mucilaginibacter]MEB0260387.1 hypothetical protein [Mucilaginibacter sp. 10I4]MEB0279426.1 hypothetical protein [Mucilaginibacter sp. 10B2]MEB0300554.1 hypothetical protein [Mucilaginibacter sp. 5C4]WPX21800.1 hypothetical protein RHM67_10930 [Mucilaginibacter sp. 5C4]